MHSEPLQEEVLAAIGRLCEGVAPELDSALSDALALSSIQLIMLLTQLCEAHGIDLMALSDADLRRMRTPRDIAATLARAGGLAALPP